MVRMHQRLGQGKKPTVKTLPRSTVLVLGAALVLGRVIPALAQAPELDAAVVKEVGQKLEG
jgi:hypothetical protein